jgi:protein-S-isoprenylcysteine O-methyltransferase Ste14
VSDRFADLFAKACGVTAEVLARRRVALGFVCGAAVLVLARPTIRSIVAGMSIAAVGEALRVWAAGHVNKAREVTSSGPYRWVAHPLYLGSTIMGIGLAVACDSVPVVMVIVVYLILTLTAAMRREEAFLRQKFGDRYDRYRRGVDARAGGAPVEAVQSGNGADRRFGLAQAIANREYRAVVGLLAATLLLFWKATYNGLFWRAGGP